MEGIIYKTTFINGKIYIGLDYQKNLHINNPFYLGSFHTEYVYTDLIKFGWDKIKPFYLSHEILWSSDDTTKQELFFKERYFIKLYKSTNIEIGYNRK